MGWFGLTPKFRAGDNVRITKGEYGGRIMRLYKKCSICSAGEAVPWWEVGPNCLPEDYMEKVEFTPFEKSLDAYIKSNL